MDKGHYKGHKGQMSDREVMKLALEALETLPAGSSYKTHNAASALRQALEQPDTGTDRGAWSDVPDATKWVDELRGDEEPEQEPVAWWNPRYGKGEYAFAEEQSPPDDQNDQSDFGWNIPLYAAPPKPAQDLIVGYADSHDIARDGHDFWVSRQPGKNTVPLYLYGHPPKIWQGLTGDEIYLRTNHIDRSERGWAVKFARAIEAKLKEKNK